MLGKSGKLMVPSAAAFGVGMGVQQGIHSALAEGEDMDARDLFSMASTLGGEFAPIFNTIAGALGRTKTKANKNDKDIVEINEVKN